MARKVEKISNEMLEDKYELVTMSKNNIEKDKLQFLIEIICQLIILFQLKGMEVSLIEFVCEYKFSAG